MANLIRLPSFFCSGMVLQQQVATILRGYGKPDDDIRVTLERSPFDGRAVSPLDRQYGRVFDQSVRCDGEGRFEMLLPVREASFDPYTLSVAAAGAKVVLENVLFGEVWIAAGQTGMQMPLAAVQTPEQVEGLANPFHLRVLSQSVTGLGPDQTKYPYRPAEDLCDVRWRRGDQPSALADVSAVGFAFAHAVHLDLKVPLGIIETALRDSYIHAWLSRDSIEQQDELRRHIQELGFYRDETDQQVTTDWTMGNLPAALYNSKVAPLAGYGARGMLWYPGENDCAYPAYYQLALQTLVRDWQHVFRAPDKRGLAFLAVMPTPHYRGQRRFTQMAEFNEMLATVRHTLKGPAAVVSIYDLPLDFADAPPGWRNPAQPTAKLPVGQRLKTVALGLLYKRRAPLSSPECSGIELVGNKLLLSFNHIGDGLRLIGGDNRLRGFAICGADRIFVEARARILYGVRVLVWHDQIPAPQAVTYAFADMNQDANLISRDHLPVLPFRSDRLASHYCPPMEWTHCEALRLWCCPSLEHPLATGWHPAWRIERGSGELVVEPANKIEGDGSLLFRYVTNDGHEAAVEPLLHYDSLHPPLDMSAYSALSVSLFNSDQHTKHVRLAVAAGPAGLLAQPLSERTAVLPVLHWQTVHFDLSPLAEQLSQVRRLILIIEDKKRRGMIYIDQIVLVRTE